MHIMKQTTIHFKDCQTVIEKTYICSSKAKKWQQY